MGQCRVASEVEGCSQTVHCSTEAVTPRPRSTLFSPAIFSKSQRVVLRERGKEGPKEIEEGRALKGRKRPHI